MKLRCGRRDTRRQSTWPDNPHQKTRSLTMPRTRSLRLLPGWAARGSEDTVGTAARILVILLEGILILVPVHSQSTSRGLASPVTSVGPTHSRCAPQRGLGGDRVAERRSDQMIGTLSSASRRRFSKVLLGRHLSRTHRESCLLWRAREHFEMPCACASCESGAAAVRLPVLISRTSSGKRASSSGAR